MVSGGVFTYQNEIYKLQLWCYDVILNYSATLNYGTKLHYDFMALRQLRFTVLYYGYEIIYGICRNAVMV